MFKDIELMGELLDSGISDFILKLREIKCKHQVGSSSINDCGEIYDSQLISKVLCELERFAAEASIEIKTLTADSDLDELLGNTEAKWCHIKTTLQGWKLLERITNANP